MSRIGKKPIEIPENVNIEIEGQEVKVSGPKGEIIQKIRPEIKVEIKDGNILVFPQKDSLSKKTRAFWGLYRTLIYNGVIGVTKGFEKKLEIKGVGYKALIEGEDIVLNVGFSHPVKIKGPEGINFSVEKNIITVSGINKEKVGEVAAKIKRIRKVEPYKGKGIRYLGEKVRRKEGKRVVAAKE